MPAQRAAGSAVHRSTCRRSTSASRSAFFPSSVVVSCPVLSRGNGAMELFSTPGRVSLPPGRSFSLRIREPLKRRPRSWKAGALASRSFAGACALALQLSPSLQVTSSGGAQGHRGLSTPASAPTVLRWERLPQNALPSDGAAFRWKVRQAEENHFPTITQHARGVDIPVPWPV